MYVKEFRKTWKENTIPTKEERDDYFQKVKTQIMELHQGASKSSLYTSFFLYHFLPAVVGKNKWKRQCAERSVSKIATISDEAFCIVLLENNIDYWGEVMMEKATNLPESETRPPSKYTFFGEKTSTRKFAGWSKAGLQRYNDLQDMVKKDRKTKDRAVVEDVLFKTYVQLKKEKEQRRKNRPYDDGEESPVKMVIHYGDTEEV